jgi:hypothetical protein
MKEYKIIDNFLHQEDFQKIESLYKDPYFPWFYNDHKVEKRDEDFQFTHIIYENFVPNSQYFSLMDPLIKKLKCKSLVRIKVNLTVRSTEIKPSLFHVDNDLDCNTAVFYLNTNNGKTMFENKEEVMSKKNRIVIFPSNLKHAGTTHTDEKIRAVININYF